MGQGLGSIISRNLTIKMVSFSLLFLPGCAADFTFPSTSSTSVNPAIQQNALSASYSGTFVTFNAQDYYSLTSPDPNTKCAGDLKAYYDPFLLNTSNSNLAGFTPPLSFPTNTIDTSTTLRPSFIKNISIDITNSNVNIPGNFAFSCSYGNGPTAPPVSNCATFDYGEINGIPSSLGGTLLIAGGLQSTNYAGIQSSYTPQHGLSVSCGPVLSPSLLNSTTGYNSCPASLFALGVNSILSSGSVAPLSSWANLAGVSNYTGPPGLAGASASYDAILNKLLIFGGSSPMAGQGATGAGTTTYETWTYDLQLQSWEHINSNTVVDSTIQLAADLVSTVTPNITLQLSKPVGARGLFGYVAVPGMAISQLSQTGDVQTGLSIPPSAAPIDTTERIIIAGGLGPCTGGVCTDVHKFNPTYGPEYFDAADAKASLVGASPFGFFPTQWIDSYYIQLVSNTQPQSVYTPFPAPTGMPAAVPSPVSLPSPLPNFPTLYSFGIVGLNNNNTLSSGIGVSSYNTPTSIPGAGYLLTAGGFYGYTSPSGNINTPNTSGNCSTLLECGGMQLFLKWFGTTSWSGGTELGASNFSYASNLNDGIGDKLTPGEWVPLQDNHTLPLTTTTPWFGGSTLLKGINLPPLPASTPTPVPSPYPPSLPASHSATNQVVYFGGADCRNYLLANTTCPNWPTAGNPGRYWFFGIDPAYTFNSGNNTTGVLPFATSPPKNAGMAAARGTDLNGNPIIVAWGGMQNAGVPDNSGIIYYLYNFNGTPYWGQYAIPSGAGPQGLANSAMVFSHVTGKFYIFGGYSINIGTATFGSSGDTWELSLDPTIPGCGKVPASGTLNSCKFIWRILNSSAGLTCYPNGCPTARRSHRIVEVNYNYFNSPEEPNCTSSSLPCSFGIFMEGGTPDGLTFLGDRWMFDPTANGGNGHWQLMGDLPPRSLASMASIDYSIPGTSTTVHRALLFGGETGMQDPVMAQAQNSAGYFVPPTLGDTWIYDFDSTSWNLPRLYGQRYSPLAIGNFPSFSELNAREGSLVGDPTTVVFTPPPTSGAVMVTRTLSKSTHSSFETPKKLVIPEVFLFGGRKKDGRYNLLNTIYKFCAGSTGEKPFPASLKGSAVPPPDDASCDAYDPLTNPSSPSPVQAFVGRWLQKNPTLTGGFDPSTWASFMGSATYDTSHDLIVLYGGLRPGSSFSTGAVTDGTKTLDSLGNPEILEYTPPSAVGFGTSGAPFNGSWATVSSCAESLSNPTGRYGHTLGYDPLNQNLIVVGGYDINGNLLQNNVTFSDGSTATLPEVWTARRIDHSIPNGIPSQNIPAVVTGPFPCYFWSQITLYNNTSNFSTGQSPSIPFTGLSHTSSVYIPSSGYNTSYYTLLDNSCINSGPIASSDPAVNKLLVGGAYFDIDRSQLGSNENLILNLTFIPLGTQNISPNLSYFTPDASAVFKVHLIKTGLSGDAIRIVPQPRDLTFAAQEQYPEIAQDIAIIAPPTGQIRQEQVYLPISMDPGIDRIRVERYSGSAILINASLFRLGQH